MTTTAVVSYSDQERMAASLVKSRLYGFDNIEQAMTLMSIAIAEGRHPATVAKDFHIINGRPAKRAEAMARDFVAGGGRIEWHQYDDVACDATFAHPQGGTVRVRWDIERARQAGLAGKTGDMYTKYPAAMFRSRTVSEGIRTVGAFASSGFYTPEETRDIIDAPPPLSLIAETVDVTPERPAKLMPPELALHLDAMRTADTTEALRLAYLSAYHAAKRAGDAIALEDFELCKNECKSKLEAAT